MQHNKGIEASRYTTLISISSMPNLGIDHLSMNHSRQMAPDQAIEVAAYVTGK